MRQNIVVSCRIWLAALFAAFIMSSASAAGAQEFSQILRGFQIAPVPLDLKGKDWALVGLGSYLVNTTGCNDCHTHPNWAMGGNPFLGETEQINTEQYLSGGRTFGPIVVSANITPDKPKNGKPAGLTLDQFLRVMRKGYDPEGNLLQVMPWPLYRYKTDRDLIAMYEYLRAIPFRPDNPKPGP
jgi:hypothetical protein